MPELSGEVSHDLPVVKRMLHALDLLRGLVTLPRNDDDIVFVCTRQRQGNGLGPVGFDEEIV